MTISLGCHKWTFRQTTTLQAARIIRALGFERMDLGNAPDLDPIEAADNMQETIRYLNEVKAETGIRYVDIFPQLPEPPNHPQIEKRRRSREYLGKWFATAAEVGLEGVTLSPGPYWPGHTLEEDFERAAEEMHLAVKKGQEYDLLTRIEPHVSSVTWTPSLAVQMVEAVPGLTLTVDHSHFIFHDIPYEQIALMHPHASHWHARQAKPGDICCTTEEGEIDFERIVTELKETGYEGTICLEFTPGKWMTCGYVDCVTETLALTEQLKGYLAQT
ncbi:MAG: TIM barrel protein [Chloroflexota bacterium]|nr:TIM barrel protein [Chloroflexota bacterium]